MLGDYGLKGLFRLFCGDKEMFDKTMSRLNVIACNSFSFILL
jgi:hypothetical protein